MKRSSSRRRRPGRARGREQASRGWSLRFDQRGRLEGVWPLYAAAALTWLLSLPLFESLSWWPLGYVVFVPWLLVVCGAKRTLHVHLASMALGLAFFLFHFRWLYSTTPEGYLAGSLYLGSYFLPASWLVRHLYRKRSLPAAIAFPLVWTAVELLRSRGPLGFPWFLLGHSQIHLQTMIQIADLAGAFGVSFVLAAVNGWLVDLLLSGIAMRFARAKSLPVGVWRGAGVVIVLLGFTVFYGRYRLATQQLVEGPRVAVLQGDFLLAADPNALGAPDSQKRDCYFKLMDEAAAHEPDMIVLPETPWTMYLNPAARAISEVCGEYHREFRRRADESGAHVVVGAMADEPQPAGSYPASHRYNSAYVYAPDVSEPARYDKIHLVPFGEFVPFRYTKSLFWLYRWLNDSDFNPWGRGGVEYSLTRGRGPTTFTMHPRGSEEPKYRFGITICYEDVIPQLFRQFVADVTGRKRVDFMLNISNDGWFGHGTQQPQHLANCAFRAVENRVAVARAVNTGVSGFIRPDGAWYDVVGESQIHPRAGGVGVRVATLLLDRRVTFYSRYGDLFAMLCGVLMLGVAVDATVRWVRGRKWWPLRATRK
ncbi:MAG TPA: apolipoprotein N-acyltransferase [Phycisphaerae bacterium]|nr:apolipoprotein N-acyltransferase [Phycisphaerae bacterium]